LTTGEGAVDDEGIGSSLPLEAKMSSISMVTHACDVEIVTFLPTLRLAVARKV
jgi:hypothetical protein